MGPARGLLLVAVVVWGWTFVATKICLEELRPMELLGLRMLIAVPVLALFGYLRGARLGAAPRVPLLLGASLFTLHFAVQISGLEHTTATNTGWIIAITPLTLAVLARFVLGERIGRISWIGIAVATVGILLLVSRGDPGTLDPIRSVGDALVLASTLTWAAYTIVTRDLSRAHDPLGITLAMVLPGAAAALIWLVGTGGWARLAALPARVLIALIFLGVLGTALAQACWQIGVARLGAARAGTFLYLEPLATMALAVPYLGEPVHGSTLLGGGLVLSGVWLSQHRQKRLR